MKLQRIVGARIIEARKEMGLSQSQLAYSAEVTRAAISKLESEETSNPSAETMLRIASRLKKPVEFFYTQYNTGFEVETTPTFRSFSSATKRDREKVDVVINRLGLFLQLLFTVVLSRDTHLPNCCNNAPDSPVNNKYIESLAASVREEWRMQNGPVRNLTNLLENNGIICFPYDLPDSVDSVNVTLRFNSEDESDRHPIIIYNNSLSYYRQRFTIAHELGHILLHSKWSKKEYEENHPMAEKQAHRFASAFLMPADSFRSSIEGTTMANIILLKDRWGISIAAICHRMSDLEIIDDQRYKSLSIELSRRGWRKEEPGDKSHSVEPPYYMYAAFKIAFDRERISPEEIVEGFGLYPEEVIKFTGNAEYFMAMPDENIQIKEVDK